MSCFRRSSRRLAAHALPAALLAVGALPCGAQTPTAVVASRNDTTIAVLGRVRGPDGHGIANAEVTVTPRPAGAVVTLGRRVYSDDSGGFRIASLPRGPATLAVRRIGYKPLAVETQLAPDLPLGVQLEASLQTLAKVVVEDRRRNYDGPLGPFNRRREFGIGRFITRGQIDARNAIRTTDLLRTIPGVQIINGSRGTAVRLRANRCDPLVWIDGTPALNGYFDIDAFGPNTIDGIEIYAGPSEVPVELRGPRGEDRCGVIAVWSRMPERRPKQSRRKALTAEEINALVANATVYTADQVDRPVQADSTLPFEAFFPDSLKRERASGLAVVEFVVDATGRVETETISVVLASHPAFGAAAREAAFSARFVPALLKGRPVRQLVQLPLEFKSTMPVRK
jgi:TonB family protein